MVGTNIQEYEDCSTENIKGDFWDMFFKMFASSS